MFFYGLVHGFICGFVHLLVIDFIYNAHLGFVPCCIVDLSTAFMLGIMGLLRQPLCLTASPGYSNHAWFLFMCCCMVFWLSCCSGIRPLFYSGVVHCFMLGINGSYCFDLWSDRLSGPHFNYGYFGVVRRLMVVYL